MRSRGTLLAGLAAGLLAAVPAHAHVAHTVESGESLWSIAAANGLSAGELATANGLSADGQLIEGSEVSIPHAFASASTSTTESSGGGSYVVQPGDTLSQIAERSGVSTEQLAAQNGLTANGILAAGVTLALSGGGDAAGEEPVPTNETLTSDQIAETAGSHGVPSDLASAVAYQESGFDNSLVSSADARGVMQIIPDTWDFVEDSIAGRDLDPTSAAENLRAGVMYLGYLLRETGDEESATASYYQGLGGVRRNGISSESRRYVDNVAALRRRFAGP